MPAVSTVVEQVDVDRGNTTGTAQGRDGRSASGAGAVRARGALSRALVAALIGLVRVYQQWVSPALPRSCRYYPSCSAYAVESLRVHGLLKGMVLATWRLLRCNPLTPGGVDHVPEPGCWRYAHPHDIPRFVIDDEAGQ